MKLMIAIPTLDYVHRSFVESLTKLCKHLSEIEVDYDVEYEGCTLVYISRDNLVRKALLDDYDYVLWLDADMVFEPDIFDKLVETGKDFVTGIYRGRHGENLPCIFEKLEPPVRWNSFDYEESIKAIKGCGFGFVLIKTDILESVIDKHGTCFRPTISLGEDLAFCKRASDIGYGIWANINAPVGHIGQYVIRPFESDGSKTNGKILKLI